MSTKVPPVFAKTYICKKCGCSLNFWRRQRHHCRACGDTFCAECSARTSVIPQYGIDKEVRVCESCYIEIQIASYHHSEDKDTNDTVRQSMFELGEDEAINLAIALSKSEVDTDHINTNANTNTNTRRCNINVNRSNSITGSNKGCPICFEERLEWALENCGHVVCGECLVKLSVCPICRKTATGALRIFISS